MAKLPDANTRKLSIDDRSNLYGALSIRPNYQLLIRRVKAEIQIKGGDTQLSDESRRTPGPRTRGRPLEFKEKTPHLTDLKERFKKFHLGSLQRASLEEAKLGALAMRDS